MPNPGPYRRGTGSPRNASIGRTEYSVQLASTSRENLNLVVEDPISNMKKVGMNKLPDDRPQPTYRELEAESEEDLDSRALF